MSQTLPRGIDPEARLRLNKLEAAANEPKQTTYSPKSVTHTSVIKHKRARKSFFAPSSGGFGAVTTTIAATITATGLTVLNQTLNGKPSFQPVMGGFVVGTFLLVISFFSAEIAAALALLLLATSVLTNAVPILRKVQ